MNKKTLHLFFSTLISNIHKNIFDCHLTWKLFIRAEPNTLEGNIINFIPIIFFYYILHLHYVLWNFCINYLFQHSDTWSDIFLINSFFLSKGFENNGLNIAKILIFKNAKYWLFVFFSGSVSLSLCCTGGVLHTVSSSSIAVLALYCSFFFF